MYKRRCCVFSTTQYHAEEGSHFHLCRPDVDLHLQLLIFMRQSSPYSWECCQVRSQEGVKEKISSTDARKRTDISKIQLRTSTGGGGKTLFLTNTCISVELFHTPEAAKFR